MIYFLKHLVKDLCMKFLYFFTAFLIVNAQMIFGAEQTIEHQAPVGQDIIENEADKLMAFFDLDYSCKQVLNKKECLIEKLKESPQEDVVGLSDHIGILIEGIRRSFPNANLESYFERKYCCYNSFLCNFLKVIPADQKKNCILKMIELFDNTFFCEDDDVFYIDPFDLLFQKCAEGAFAIIQNPHILEYLHEIMEGYPCNGIQTKTIILSSLNELSKKLDNDIQMGNTVRYIAKNLPLIVKKETELQDKDDKRWFYSHIKESIMFLNTINRYHLSELCEPFLSMKISSVSKLCVIRELLECIAPQHSLEGYYICLLPIDHENFCIDIRIIFCLNIEGDEYSLGKIVRRISICPAIYRRQLVVDLIRKKLKEKYTAEEITDHFYNFLFCRERHRLDAAGRLLLGIDVHSNDRETKTAQSLELLVQHQGHLSTQKMEELYADCKNYINAGHFTDDEKRRALIALEGARLSPDDWNNLLSQEPSILFANLDGLSLIARLWHFADTYTDPNILNEAENTRRSFVLACVDSAYSDGHMVCNPGKVQRIVCSVLQGRLAGVEVDPLPKLTGRDFASIYLQSLNGRDVTNQSEPVFLSAASAWLRTQEATLTDEEKTKFINDVKLFYNLSN